MTVSGSEIVAALASGALDALKWNNPYGEASMGFWRYAKNYYHPGWQDPTTSIDIVINKKEWDALPNDLKAIVEYCAASANAAMLNEFMANNAPYLDVFVKKHGVVLKQFPDELLVEFGNATGEVVSALAAADPLSRKVFDSMLKWRGMQMQWTGMSEQSFMRARALPYKFPTA